MALRMGYVMIWALTEWKARTMVLSAATTVLHINQSRPDALKRDRSRLLGRTISAFHIVVACCLSVGCVPRTGNQKEGGKEGLPPPTGAFFITVDRTTPFWLALARGARGGISLTHESRWAAARHNVGWPGWRTGTLSWYDAHQNDGRHGSNMNPPATQPPRDRI